MNKNLKHESDDLDDNFSDESLADYLELLIRMTPTTMPEWMN